MVGTTVGSYKILKHLGEGGMGIVYLGLDTQLDRYAAVKVLSPELSQDAQLVERFHAEARAQAHLNHPNIATIYSFFQQSGVYYIAMEYVQGETLADRVHSIGPIPPDQLLPLFKQALSGIAHAHRAGIVHRDIKPGNIIITPSSIVKVMDFGIARILGGRRLTRTGSAVGTLLYMSPEQIRNRPVDHRSDIYSLGVTLYEVVTGRVPFESDSDYEIMRAHLEDPPPLPTSLHPYTPKGLEQIILKSIEKDPGDRFQTAEEFAEALERFETFSYTVSRTPSGRDRRTVKEPAYRSVAGATEPMGIPVATPERPLHETPRRGKTAISKRILLVGSLSVLVLALGIAGWLLWRRFARPRVQEADVQSPPPAVQATLPPEPVKTDTPVDLARKALGERQWESALRYLSSVLSQTPEDSSALEMQDAAFNGLKEEAQRLHESGDHRAARVRFEQMETFALQYRVKNWISEANALAKKESDDLKAREQQALKAGPAKQSKPSESDPFTKLRESALGSARDALAGGQWKPALDSLAPVLSEKPNDMEALALRGRAMVLAKVEAEQIHAGGNHRAAMQRFRELTDAAQKYGAQEWARDFANLAKREEGELGAEADQEKQRKLDNIGKAVSLNHWQAALELLAPVLSAAPNDAEALALRDKALSVPKADGEKEHGAGDHKAARQTFERMATVARQHGAQNVAHEYDQLAKREENCLKPEIECQVKHLHHSLALPGSVGKFCIGILEIRKDSLAYRVVSSFGQRKDDFQVPWSNVLEVEKNSLLVGGFHIRTTEGNYNFSAQCMGDAQLVNRILKYKP